MSESAKRYLQWVWIGVAVQIAGRIRDGIWHTSNDEFEAAAQQVEAHWIAWLGIAITLAAAALAVSRLNGRKRNAGYVITLAGGMLYVPVAIWHFVEHANYNDPELAHYLIAIGQIVILAGAAVALILSRRRPEPAA